MKTILVTGASGLVGRHLLPLLLRKKYRLRTLGSGRSPHEAIAHFSWNPAKCEIDESCLEGVTDIIHLAGAGIAQQRWTTKRKIELHDSRVKSEQLILEALQRRKQSLHTFISASAVGYYGEAGDEWLHEDHPPATDFLGQLCANWEQAAFQFGTMGARVVCLRTGIVLSPEGGAMHEFEKSMRLGVAGYFQQQPLWYSWIAAQDLCNIYLHALQIETMAGSYNAVAPQPMPMKDLIHSIRLHRYPAAWLLPVPTLGLRMALGEMADMLLCSQRCACEKIQQTGFRFQFPKLADALRAMED